jgi:hypothetical protein
MVPDFNVIMVWPTPLYGKENATASSRFGVIDRDHAVKLRPGAEVQDAPCAESHAGLQRRAERPDNGVRLQPERLDIENVQSRCFQRLLDTPLQSVVANNRHNAVARQWCDDPQADGIKAARPCRLDERNGFRIKNSQMSQFQERFPPATLPVAAMLFI